jgi:predicted DNA-binding antitoxin AbrB/MazE fold protein
MSVQHAPPRHDRGVGEWGIIGGPIQESAMSDIKAHYDGKVFVPHEPVNLGDGEEVVLRVERAAVIVEAERVKEDRPKEGASLRWMLENPIESDDLPSDLSRNHDHYLYGTPKRES